MSTSSKLNGITLPASKEDLILKIRQLIEFIGRVLQIIRYIPLKEQKYQEGHTITANANEVINFLFNFYILLCKLILFLL
jgi:hypothetical protein